MFPDHFEPVTCWDNGALQNCMTIAPPTTTASLSKRTSGGTTAQRPVSLLELGASELSRSSLEKSHNEIT